MSKATVLAEFSDPSGKTRRISVSEYNEMVFKRDTGHLAEFVYYRFYGRYIKPFFFRNSVYKKHYKNGFAMLASGCLLIEALESFYQGTETTQGRGDDVFDSFFKRSTRFKELSGVGFYKNIRCGLLHQAETTGGFVIGRTGPLFESHKKRINTQKFLEALDSELQEYKRRLTRSDWDSELWDNFRRKMRFIIKHCG